MKWSTIHKEIDFTSGYDLYNYEIHLNIHTYANFFI